MSTYRQKCARQLCGQLKSNQNRQIWHKLAIHEVWYSYFVYSYQDKNIEMIRFSKKCCLCPPTGKNVPNSFVDNSNPIKISSYGIDWQWIKFVTLILCPVTKIRTNKLITVLKNVDYLHQLDRMCRTATTTPEILTST